jgi:hypothetical protein
MTMEAIRLENAFADGMRGLMVYGQRSSDPKALGFCIALKVRVRDIRG